MASVRFVVRLVMAGALGAAVLAQGAASRKRLLVIGEEKGYRHEAVTHAMVTIERLGRETGLW
ncbi:MAG: ThuA domain-containing protein, partial [Acidobacteriota bacterium]|nr:ThuA domain-containing protein [Acidobacteriota bacterium]